MTMAVQRNVCLKTLNPSVLLRTSVAVWFNVCLKTRNPFCSPSRIAMALAGGRIVNNGAVKMKGMWPSMLRLGIKNEPAGYMMGVARYCTDTDIEGSDEEGPEGNLGILWDLNSCGDTKSLSQFSHEEAAVAMARTVLTRLREQLPLDLVAITTFIAYGDPSNFPQCSNFKIIMDENISVQFQIVAEKHLSVKPDWVEKAIITDMFMFALNNPPLSKLIVLSDKENILLPATYELAYRDYLVMHAVFKLK
ncbi:hypothetical protein KI387_031143, partial [Taxus chinensis]